MLICYTLSTCDTCRRAVKWLREHDIAFEERAIRETPPAPAELKRMLEAYDGENRRLFNVSGRDYREMKLGPKVAVLTVDEVVELLGGNGNLIKRPFLIGPKVALVGFDEPAWRAALLE